MAGSLVKLSESIFEVFILCFQSYLCSFCTISSGLRVQFRYLLANLRKIYIHDLHDVNVGASQADRALNWTARMNKVVERVTQEQIHIFRTKNIPSISGLPRIVVNLALHAVLFWGKNVYAVTKLLLDGTRSVLCHLIWEKMSKIVAIQP